MEPRRTCCVRLSSFLSTAFLASFLSRGSQRVWAVCGFFTLDMSLWPVVSAEGTNTLMLQSSWAEHFPAAHQRLKEEEWKARCRKSREPASLRHDTLSAALTALVPHGFSPNSNIATAGVLSVCDPCASFSGSCHRGGAAPLQRFAQGGGGGGVVCTS